MKKTLKEDMYEELHRNKTRPTGINIDVQSVCVQRSVC